MTAGQTSVTVRAALWCTTDDSDAADPALTCSGGEDDSGAPHLKMARGAPLDVKVPQEVSSAPWVIVFAYNDTSGAAHGDRTQVFAPNAQVDYTLQPPTGAQLTRVEVQVLTAAPATGGGVEYPATQTWVLLVDPA